ncbi:MAG: hypothetical protein ACO1RX_16370 [Candidatus Sericytochromatia bacterium]
MLLTLSACEATVPVSAAVPAARQTSQVFRWSVLVSPSRQLGIQAVQVRQPLALENVERVWVGDTLIERSAITAPSTLSPSVAAWREQLQARNAALAKERAETLKQQAAAAEQRRLAAEDKRKREQAEQSARLRTQATAAETTPASYQLSYLGSGRFLLERSDGGDLPNLVRMEVKGFAEALTVPVLTATQTPLVVAASQNAAGQTQITGGLTPPPSDLPETGQPFFNVRYDADGIAYLDWTGSESRFSAPLEGPASGDALPDPIAEQMALIDQLFARLENSFQPSSSDGPAVNPWNTGWDTADEAGESFTE